MPNDDPKVYRVIDANINRLREALRVIEEYARFVLQDEPLSGRLKEMRHEVRTLSTAAGTHRLLQSRDTEGDPLADGTRPEELVRAGAVDVLQANLKRGQEAARVLEEYTKVTDLAGAADTAKRIRFGLYAVEKQLVEHLTDG